MRLESHNSTATSLTTGIKARQFPFGKSLRGISDGQHDFFRPRFCVSAMILSCIASFVMASYASIAELFGIAESFGMARSSSRFLLLIFICCEEGS